MYLCIVERQEIVIQGNTAQAVDERPSERVVSKNINKQRKEKVMSMMTFITFAAVMFVGASALALVMDHMVEGTK